MHSQTERLAARTLNCRGRLLDLSRPVVMGILNVTPDSFFDGGRLDSIDLILQRAGQMLKDGAALLDIGGASSRPGAQAVSADAEKQRVLPAIEAILKRFPDTLLSIDTWNAAVAKAALESGAAIVNDISGGRFDPGIMTVAAAYGSPYVLMHMQGNPATMQEQPVYDEVVREVLDFFIETVPHLQDAGIADIVLDPGFGFGKTVEHNYRLLKHLSTFSSVLNRPVLAGLSRKSMICKVLHVNPDQALNGTTALHMVALQQGAAILRAHDVREAMEVIKLWEQLEQ